MKMLQQTKITLLVRNCCVAWDRQKSLHLLDLSSEFLKKNL